ncbi:MAG: hypothetical protein JO257_36460 [Deltaproteobacteria bacterium]|nr:hypothetical protein [Deltaproteobacteria bacterium]
MSTSDDNDFLTGPVPEPEAEATPAERAHAKTFADLVDKTLAGRTPPAMSADDRALLEVATVIRAASGKVELPAQTKRSLVEDALKQAIGGAGRSTVVPISRARRRWLPWTVASVSSAVAAAAIALLIVRTPPRTVTTGAALLPLPIDQRSRPTDSLFGPIARDHAGDATTRIDTIFADRLDGYRDRELGRGGKP